VLARGVPDVTPVEAPACACVIVAFHRPDSLAGLLASLAGPAMELVVVNVGDDPAVRRVVDTTGATHVPLPGNPGYAAAVNLGAAHPRAEIVLFRNDDLAVPAATARALAAVVRDGEADVAVPCLVNGDGAVEATAQALPSPGSLLLEWALLPDRPVAA